MRAIQKGRDCCTSINNAINGAIERGFWWLGYGVGRFPWITIVLSIIAAGGLATGCLQIEWESRPEKLWIPSGTQSTEDKAVVDELYPSFGQSESYYITNNNANGNVLSPEAFDTAHRVRQATLDTTWANKKNDEDDDHVPWFPQPTRYTDMCLSRGGSRGAGTAQGCVYSDVLALFGYEPDNWATEDDILTTLNNPGQWDTSLLGDGFVIESVLGGIQRSGSGNNGRITGARALAARFVLAGNATLEDTNDGDDTQAGWEGEWLDSVEAVAEDIDGFAILPQAGRSITDELDSTIRTDTILLQGAIFGVIIYTAIAISNCRDGCVGVRISLTFGGMLNVLLAIGAAFGLGAYCGLLFSQLMMILPFILTGIGADGMFVLQHALDLTDTATPLPERVAHTVSTGGVSVALASLTNVGAFAIGSNTTLPALRAFSVFAALAVLFDLLLQVTFFAAIMTINKKREAARRWDCCCFKTSQRSVEDEKRGCGKRRPSTIVMSWLGTMLAKRPVQAVVLLAWVGLLAVGIAGTAQMKVEADVNNFIPTTSYLRDYFDITDNYFQTSGDSLGVYFQSTDDTPVDFSRPAIQEEIESTIEALRASRWTLDESFDSWLAAFASTFDDGEPNPATFYDDLSDFLGSAAGSGYASDIVWNDASDPEAGIESSRITFNWVFIDQPINKVPAMDEMREIVDAVPAPLGNNALVFGGSFTQVEQYAAISDEALINIALACAMIAVVVFLLLGNLLASLLTFVAVASAIVATVGILYFTGFRIDSVSILFLVISLGLAVDYSVHVAHGFLTVSEADDDARLKRALTETGTPVLNGAASTLVAALFLSGSGSQIFFTLFCTLITVVLCGAFMGLIVLPVFMAICKPAAHAKHMHGVAATPPDRSSTSTAMHNGSSSVSEIEMPAKGQEPHWASP